MKLNSIPIFVTFIILGSPAALLASIICPPSNSSNGWWCEDTGHLQFQWDKLTQQNITDMFDGVFDLNHNNLTNDLININLIIDSTPLEILDLTPLLGFRISMFLLDRNDNLVKIVGPTPPSNSTQRNTLELTNLQLGSVNNQGIDVDLTDLFKAAGHSLKTIEVHNSRVQSSFLQGLSYLTGLEQINMAGNSISRLDGGQLKSNRIQRIVLDGNRISGIGEGTFDLNKVDSGMVDTELIVSLAGNKLTDGNIHSNHGLSSVGRPIRWILNGNNFVFISQNKFETFLYADRNNTLVLNENQFICDSRMKWLKDARQLLENRVLGVDCINDPGHTIFTTDLV